MEKGTTETKLLALLFLSLHLQLINTNNLSNPTSNSQRVFYSNNSMLTFKESKGQIWKGIEKIINSTMCQKKWSCSENYDNFEERTCFCDRLCHIFSDCCEDLQLKTNKSTDDNEENSSHIIKPWSNNIFQCIPDPTKQRRHVYIIVACPHDYNNTDVKNACEQGNATQTVISELLGGYVIFSNVYCAICHNVQDIKFWTPLFKCEWKSYSKNNSFPTNSQPSEKFYKNMNCHVTSFSYTLKEKLRECHDYIRDCPYNELSSFSQHCLSNHSLYPVMHTNSKVFKNIFCALCNNAKIDELSCFNKTSYSIRSLVKNVSRRCENGEDLHDGTCKETQTIQKVNCTLLKLRENEYTEFNDTVFIKRINKFVNKSLFYMQPDGHSICLKNYISMKNESRIKMSMVTKMTEKYLFISGFVFSIPTLFIAFSVYCYFSTLRNIPGKMAMNLMASLFLANIVFFLANIIKGKIDHVLCQTIAIIAHYTYLVSFCWMNVMAFDSWQTFSRKQILSITERGYHSFKFYMIYSWLTPTIIVTGAGITQFLHPNSTFSPAYGYSLCWFNNKQSLLVFFGVPLIIIQITNIIFFIFTFRAIYLANKFTRRCLSTGDQNTFVVFFKLYFILGINWLIALLYHFTEIEILRHISVLFTSFQGFFVGCSYLMSRKVCRQFKNKLNLFSTQNFTEYSNNPKTILHLENIKSPRRL